MRGPIGLSRCSPILPSPPTKYDDTDMRNVDPRWQPDNFEKNVEAEGRLGDLAAAKGVIVSQLALAWLPTRGEHVVPSLGARSVQRIEENAGAVDVSLTGTDLATTDEILLHDGFGARYAEEHAPVSI
ncbi:aldo/keto reductase [Streptomyces griseiscabiei]|uniref:Aldo/keto reductase n=1 Tax=Streptomyces griseiscabiei TaxID=2993540 RepID=A0ABU4KXE2_9ACTN|nr:aldo/keto reductase [Streptomyces griseiscabiei]MDX2908120.1 aldo/keto reductase [Streptomyces griseiscabiei]